MRHATFLRPERSPLRQIVSFAYYLILYLTGTTAFAQLNGSYTIGGSNADYATFGEAVDALQAEGISGPVTFRVRPGIYNEQVEIRNISGSSCEIPIVFEGETKDSTDVELVSTGPSFLLEGSDGITFRYLTIAQVYVGVASDCITLEHNSIGRIDAYSGAGTAANHRHRYRYNRIFSLIKKQTTSPGTGSFGFDDGLEIVGNVVFGRGIELVAQRGAIISDNIIEVNEYGVYDQDINTGIDLLYCGDGGEIRNNIIRAKSYYGRVRGIRAVAGIPQRISENRISMDGAERIENPFGDDIPGLGGGTAMELSAGVISGEVLVANNDIFVDGYDRSNALASLCGIVIKETNEGLIKIYHNTVRTVGYQTESSALQIESTVADNRVQILNNTLLNGSDGSDVFVSRPSSVAVIDYNHYGGILRNGGGGLVWGSTAFSGYSEWTQNARDIFGRNSIVSGPVAGEGISVAEVDRDINGKPRANPPTIGAFERNDSPTVSVGEDLRFINLPQDSIVIQGSFESSEVAAYAYQWELRSEPRAKLIPNGATLTITNLQNAAYFLTFKAFDEQGVAYQEFFTVGVNAPPQADAGEDRTVTLPVDTVVLRGTATDVSPFGRLRGFQWEKVSGPPATLTQANTANLLVSDLEAGEYVFRFTATDERQATGSDEIVLTVKGDNGDEGNESGNQPPTVSAGPDKTLMLPTSSTVLRGTGSDPDGVFRSFRWEKVSGPSATLSQANTANLKLSNLVAGEYMFRFTATDNDGAMGSDEVTVIVIGDEPTNQPPVANAGSDRTITLPANTITLRGGGSDPDGVFRGFRWEKVSGPSVTLGQANTANLKLSDLVAGEYVFRFTVTDNDGATDSDETTLTVRGAPGAAPLASNTRVTAYPNTFRDQVNVEIRDAAAESYQLIVYDALGRVHYQTQVATGHLGSKTQYVDLANRNLPAGAYFIAVEAVDFQEVIRVMKTN